MKFFKLKANEPNATETIISLAYTIDRFEQYHRPHASQIARLSEALALQVGIRGVDLNDIKLAALLHDIGEMAMAENAIRYPGRFELKQRIELWRHPIIGEQQLAKRELSRAAQLIVRSHHEWWNGFGYPDMLAGTAIPLGARIIRLVDTYDALTAQRPYRQSFTVSEALEMIKASAGIEFDPQLVQSFLAMIAELEKQAQQKNAALKILTSEPVILTEAQPPAQTSPPVEELVGEVEDVSVFSAASLQEITLDSVPNEPSNQPTTVIDEVNKVAEVDEAMEVREVEEVNEAIEVSEVDETSRTEPVYEAEEINEVNQVDQDIEVDEVKEVTAAEVDEMSRVDEVEEASKVSETIEVSKVDETIEVSKVDETIEVSKVSETIEVSKVDENVEVSEVNEANEANEASKVEENHSIRENVSPSSLLEAKDEHGS